MELKERKDIEEKYKFDLSKFCKSSEEFYEREDKLLENAQKIIEFKGQLGNPDKLLELEKLSDELNIELQKLASYALLNLDVDLQNQEYQKMFSSVQNANVEIASLLSFTGEEIKSYGKEYLEKLIADPRFKDYKIQYMDIIRELDHILSEHDSYIVSQMSDFADFENTHSVLVNSEIRFDKPLDSKGKAYDLTWGTYSALMKDEDRTLRENTYHSACKGMEQFKSSLFSLILNEYKADDFQNRLAKYDSVLEAEMSSYNVPVAVFDKIIEQASKNPSENKSFKESKRKLLGLKKLEPWDAYLPIIKENKQTTFEDAVQIMEQCFKCLGNTYVDALHQAVEERWCDVYPCKDKNSSIYSSYDYSTTPILHLNWSNKTEDVFIFSHEFGHAVQFLVTRKSQPYATCGLPWIMVEVPSLMCETLMFQHMYATAKTNDEKLLALQNFIETFQNNVFAGCAQAKFERYLRDSVRDNEPLDVETASQEYLQIVEAFIGEPPHNEARYNWMRDSHFFSSYYNYVYSISMIVAVTFAKGIYNGDENVKNNFYKFMETGSSKYILDNLKDCGIDLLDDKIYNDAFDFYKNAVNKFNNIVDKKLTPNHDFEK